MRPTSESQSVSYYDILGIHAEASDEEVRRAFKTMAIKFHPDHNPDNANASEHRLRQITEAYAKIKTAQQRIHYNRWLKTSGRLKAANHNASWMHKLAGFLTGTPS